MPATLRPAGRSANIHRTCRPVTGSGCNRCRRRPPSRVRPIRMRARIHQWPRPCAPGLIAPVFPAARRYVRSRRGRPGSWPGGGARPGTTACRRCGGSSPSPSASRSSPWVALSSSSGRDRALPGYRATSRSTVNAALAPDGSGPDVVGSGPRQGAASRAQRHPRRVGTALTAAAEGASVHRLDGPRIGDPRARRCSRGRSPQRWRRPAADLPLLGTDVPDVVLLHGEFGGLAESGVKWTGAVLGGG
jgi:hypothetical protein